VRPTKRSDSGQHDLLRSRLDRIVNLAHPLAKQARSIDGSFLDQKLGAAYTDRPGRPADGAILYLPNPELGGKIAS